VRGITRRQDSQLLTEKGRLVESGDVAIEADEGEIGTGPRHLELVCEEHESRDFLFAAPPPSDPTVSAILGVAALEARRRANVTQQELAVRLGKPQSFVSEYERGKRRIDVVELLVISRALGVDPVDLFGEIVRSAVASRATAASV
jgi:hypothetical protein